MLLLVQRHTQLAPVASHQQRLRVGLGHYFAGNLNAAGGLAGVLHGFGLGRSQQLQNSDKGLARYGVVPGFVAHDDFQQLVHGLGPHAAHHQHPGFGQAGVEVAFVDGNQGVKLVWAPGAARVAHDKVDGVQKLAQRLKAQLARNGGQGRSQRSGSIVQGVGFDQQLDVVIAGVVVAGVHAQGFQQLVERGFISKADVDRKTATRDAARARVNVANAQLAETRARNARLDVRAPVSGYVLERNVEPGQTVSAGSGILFRIAKDGELELQAKLSEDDLGQVAVGIPATVTPVGTDRIFNGSIWQIAPMIDAQSRQGMARIALPFDTALRPGGFASVEIKAGAMTAPVLPESAVQTGREGSFVYIVGKDNKVKQRPVKVGSVTANGLIIEQGLDGTERVVLYAGGFLNPGETINPKILKKQ